MLDSPVRRLCAAVTATPWSADPDTPPHTGPGSGPHARPHRGALEAAEHACRQAGLHEAFVQEVTLEPGDGRAAPDAVLLVMPPGVNEARVIGDLVRGLDDAHTVTATGPAGRPEGGSSRLVIAFDQGITRLTDAGFEGNVVTAVLRLAAEERSRSARRGDPGARVGVVITAALLDDLTPPPAAWDTPATGEAPGGRVPVGSEPLTVDLPGRRVAAWSYPSGRSFRLPDRSG